jgi:hypothetical protein
MSGVAALQIAFWTSSWAARPSCSPRAAHGQAFAQKFWTNRRMSSTTFHVGCIRRNRTAASPV